MARLRLTICHDGTPLVTVIDTVGGTEIESVLEGVTFAQLAAAGSGSVFEVRLMPQFVDLKKQPAPERAMTEGEAPARSASH